VLHQPGRHLDTESVDNAIYLDLLYKYIQNGVMDYHLFENDEKDLHQHIMMREQTNIKEHL
jgi:hypothetical protein